MLTIGGGLTLLTRFCRAIRPPKVVLVSLHDASSIAALGAAALDHCASSSASISSPFTPGSAHELLPLGCTCMKLPPVNADNPNFERNLVQSATSKTSVSSITTMASPWPEIPAVNSGFRL